MFSSLNFSRSGSSPRVWGTLILGNRGCSGVRFIPTGVGNALAAPSSGILVAVHPHGCGERAGTIPGITDQRGSSPRVWGTQILFCARLRPGRFIPTGVGNA